MTSSNKILAQLYAGKKIAKCSMECLTDINNKAMERAGLLANKALYAFGRLDESRREHAEDKHEHTKTTEELNRRINELFMKLKLLRASRDISAPAVPPRKVMFNPLTTSGADNTDTETTNRPESRNSEAEPRTRSTKIKKKMLRKRRNKGRSIQSEAFNSGLSSDNKSAASTSTSRGVRTTGNRKTRKRRIDTAKATEAVTKFILACGAKSQPQLFSKK